MAKNSTPSFETTAGYLEDTVDYLGKRLSVAEKHKSAFMHIPEDPKTEDPYVVAASLDIPRRINWESARTARFGTRTLKVVVYGSVMSIDDFNQIPPVIGVPESAQFNDRNRTATPILGRLVYDFNTKRLIDSEATVYREGYHMGIQEDEDLPEFVFRHFDMAKSEQGRHGYRVLADIVEDDSMRLNTSYLETISTVDFFEEAAAVARESGKPIPKSLINPPRVSIQAQQPLLKEEDRGRPYGTRSVLTIDHSNYGRRVVTDVQRIDYVGYTPDQAAQDRHFHFQQYADANVGVHGIGVDVSHSVSSKYEDPLKTGPSDDDEARQMVAPFIRTMTNFIRYENAAFPAATDQASETSQ